MNPSSTRNLEKRSVEFTKLAGQMNETTKMVIPLYYLPGAILKIMKKTNSRSNGFLPSKSILLWRYAYPHHQEENYYSFALDKNKIKNILKESEKGGKGRQITTSVKIYYQVDKALCVLHIRD